MVSSSPRSQRTFDNVAYVRANKRFTTWNACTSSAVKAGNWTMTPPGNGRSSRRRKPATESSGRPEDVVLIWGIATGTP